MKPTNGHRSYAAFTVWTWLMNDKTIHGVATVALKRAKAERETYKSEFLRSRPVYYYAAVILLGMLPERTPCGQVRYSVKNLREALKGFSE